MQSKGSKVLILGGTKEAAQLARELVSDGFDVVTSLAGRTREPKPLAGAVRSGGFGGYTGLAHWLQDNGIDTMIDATHPFAFQISDNAKRAAAMVGVALESRQRPPWTRQKGDIWIEVSSLDAAASAIPAGARVLLALGSQHLDGFSKRDDVHFTVRMIDEPGKPLPLARHNILLARPSPDSRDEEKKLRDENISHIVCRNSGGTGAYAKIEAARALELPVIIVQRPIS